MTFEIAGPDDDLRLEYLHAQIAARRDSALELRAAAEAALSNEPPDLAVAESNARQALYYYARSLDWAEDTDVEEGAHRLMDDAGHWVRSTFGCSLSREGTTYRQTCPIALAHNRLGFSIGGSAVRTCSVCGGDLSECDHFTGTAYMVPGGPDELGWCRVCLKEQCDHRASEEYRVSVIAIIKEMTIDEVSLVDKPAQPEARIAEVSVSISDLQAALGDEFVPGMEVNCDKCLLPCPGLIRHTAPHG